MSFDKFRVLTWKNWTLQKRRPIAGAVQILFPILVIVLFTWARNAFGNEFDLILRTDDAKSYSLANFTACTSSRGSDPEKENVPLTKIHFAPDSAAYRELIQDAFGSRFFVEGHSELEMQQAIRNGTEQSMGVIFYTDSPVCYRSYRRLIKI